MSTCIAVPTVMTYLTTYTHIHTYICTYIHKIKSRVPFVLNIKNSYKIQNICDIMQIDIARTRNGAILGFNFDKEPGAPGQC